MSDHPHLLTPGAYAKACGISRQAVASRLQKGTLTTTPLEVRPGHVRQVIDTRLYPPESRQQRQGLPPLLLHRVRKKPRPS